MLFYFSVLDTVRFWAFELLEFTFTARGQRTRAADVHIDIGDYEPAVNQNQMLLCIASRMKPTIPDASNSVTLICVPCEP